MEKKKHSSVDQENFLLKKIRHYQGTIADYETFWNQKIAEGEKEECPETKSFKKHNAELNKAFEIVPVKPGDDTPEKVDGNDIEDEGKDISKKKCHKDDCKCEEDGKKKDKKKDKDEE